MKLLRQIPIAIMLIAVFSGCMERRTSDPTKAYRYWAGANPPENIRVINGQYWRSSHWTLEYIIYLEISAPGEWIEALKKENGLMMSNVDSNIIPAGKPAWFNPGKDFQVFYQNGLGLPVLYVDPAGGHIYLYDSVL